MRVCRRRRKAIYFFDTTLPAGAPGRVAGCGLAGPRAEAFRAWVHGVGACRGAPESDPTCSAFVLSAGVVGEGTITFSELGPPIALRAHAVGVTTKATVSGVRWHSYGDLDVRQVQ